ncbi:MAG: hypothetical protein J4G12_05350 [Gemmatimonadetes bacterium]|nr:hypothetical protein [Gemmatimonadota bacterium]
MTSSCLKLRDGGAALVFHIRQSTHGCVRNLDAETLTITALRWDDRRAMIGNGDLFPIHGQIILEGLRRDTSRGTDEWEGSDHGEHNRRDELGEQLN